MSKSIKTASKIIMKNLNKGITWNYSSSWYFLFQKTNTSYSVKQGRSLKKRERCQSFNIHHRHVAAFLLIFRPYCAAWLCTSDVKRLDQFFFIRTVRSSTGNGLISLLLNQSSWQNVSQSHKYHKWGPQT